MRPCFYSKHLILYLFITISFLAPGCVYVESSYNRRHVTNLISLKIILHEGDRDNLSEGDDVIQRRWISRSKWYPNPSSDYINISFTEDDLKDSIGSENIRIDEYGFNASLPKSYRTGEQVNIYVSSDLGEISFEGQLGSGEYGHNVTASGIVVIEVNNGQIDQIKEAFGQEPTLDILIPLIIKDISAEKLIEYTNCGIKLSIEHAGELANNDFKADTINRLVDVGYKFNGEDFISLARHNVSGDYAIGWKKTDYDLSAKQLIYAKQRNLDFDTAMEWQKTGRELSLEQLHWTKQRNIHPQEAKKWKEAGRELSLDQMQWVRQRNIHPQEAEKWKEAGRELSLEQLHWVRQRNISPKDFTSWYNAGYELSLDKLNWARQRNLNPQEAVRWKKMGYDLSIEELYRLRQNNIQSSYGEAFADPEYEPVSIEQLIEFKRSNISPETIKKLRKRKEN